LIAVDAGSQGAAGENHDAQPNHVVGDHGQAGSGDAPVVFRLIYEKREVVSPLWHADDDGASFSRLSMLSRLLAVSGER